jgi:hypothetical protein
MKLKDQPAVMEWFPTVMRAARRHQPFEIARQRKNFDTVAAAVAHATSTLPEAFRNNATIATGDITLRWLDIAAMSKSFSGAS